MTHLALIALLLLTVNPAVAHSPPAAAISPPVIACDVMAWKDKIVGSIVVTIWLGLGTQIWPETAPTYPDEMKPKILLVWVVSGVGVLLWLRCEIRGRRMTFWQFLLWGGAMGMCAGAFVWLIYWLGEQSPAQIPSSVLLDGPRTPAALPKLDMPIVASDRDDPVALATDPARRRLPRAMLTAGISHRYISSVPKNFNPKSPNDVAIFAHLEIQNSEETTTLKNWRMIFYRDDGEPIEGRVVYGSGALAIKQPNGRFHVLPIPIEELWQEKGAANGIAGRSSDWGWLIAVFSGISAADFFQPGSITGVVCNDMDGGEWELDYPMENAGPAAHHFHPGQGPQSKELRELSGDALASLGANTVIAELIVPPPLNPKLPLSMHIRSGTNSPKYMRLEGITLTNNDDRDMSLSFQFGVFYESLNGRPDLIVVDGKWNGAGEEQLGGSSKVSLPKGASAKGSLNFVIDSDIPTFGRRLIEDTYLEITDSVSGLSDYGSYMGYPPPRKIRSLDSRIEKWNAKQKTSESNPGASTPNSGNPKEGESNES